MPNPDFRNAEGARFEQSVRFGYFMNLSVLPILPLRETRPTTP
jgi:hypothetical protein